MSKPNAGTSVESSRGAIFVFVAASVLANAASATESKLLPGGLAANDLAGLQVALDGDVLAIGASGHDGRAIDDGAVFVFERSGGVWSEAAELTASDPVAHAVFGRSVAVDGTRILIGAPGATGSAGGTGAVYVFERGASGWDAVGKIVAADGAAGDEFGSAVALDGDRALIGAASGDGIPFVTDSGAAYVFEYANGSWIETGKLLEPLHGQHLDDFGRVVDLSGDRAIIGVPAGYGQGTGSGRAALFERSGATWSLAATLFPNGISFDNGLEYGRAVAIDGDRAVVTSPYGGPATGFSFAPGMADVYRKNGTAWQLEARVVPFGADALHQWGMEFGVSVALDDDTLVVGAADSWVDGDGRGAAYVFERLPVGWVQVAVFRASDSAPFDWFARSIASSSGVIALGAPGDDDSGSNSGSVVLFDLPSAGSPAISSAPSYLSPFVPGDSQTVRLDLGPAHAGRFALTLGSLSGTTPGLGLGAFHLPLNYDFYFAHTIGAPAIGPLVPGLVTLDASGVAEVDFVIPTLSSEVANLLLGFTLHHAAVILDPVTNQVRGVTAAVPLIFAG